MKLLKNFALLSLLLIFAVSCSDTGNRPTDATSAQRLLPNLANYSATDVDTTIDGAFAAFGGASLLSGQVAITAVFAKAEQILQCFQDRGALAAKFYRQLDSTVTAPKIGGALVINQSRINQEVLNCILGGQEGNANAQTIALEPCYVGSHPDVCEVFQLHFDNLAGVTDDAATATPGA